MNIRKLFKPNQIINNSIIVKKKEINNKINQAIENDRFSLFELCFVKDFFRKIEILNNEEAYKDIFEMVDGWDNRCKLPRKAGEYINKMILENPDCILAIHRTYLGHYDRSNQIPYNKLLEDIMKIGLTNNGHAMQGGETDNPSLSLTTNPLDSLGDIVNLIGSYNSNNTTILLMFPRNLIDEELDFINKEDAEKIYTLDYNIPHINPDYILGAIIKNKNGLDEFYTREELLNSKSYSL